MSPIILASTSRSRLAILQGSGVAFEVVAPGVDEAKAKPLLMAQGKSAGEIAQALADLKALAVADRRQGLVIGADQTLECAGKLYDKADTVQEARRNLTELRGRRHHLHSAVALAEAGEIVWRVRDRSSLTMRRFSQAFLDAYLRGQGEAILGAVGGYRLEGEGAQLFDRVRGDYFSILGLPLMPLLGELRARGALAS